jgi:DNA invertase Pin-like site-specific DNA recombinase
VRSRASPSGPGRPRPSTIGRGRPPRRPRRPARPPGATARGCGRSPTSASPSRGGGPSCAASSGRSTPSAGGGWRLEKVARDVERPGDDRPRPGLKSALEGLGRGEASCLIVAELGRLSRSAAELGRLIEWLRRHELRLLALDIELDTATAVGQMAAEALISVGARERERGGARAERGAARDPAKAGAVGRPAVGDIPALKRYIAALRAGGMTLQGIADRLNAEGVPTLRGGKEWRPSSVQAAVGYRRPPPRPAHSRAEPGRSDVSGGAP